MPRFSKTRTLATAVIASGVLVGGLALAAPASADVKPIDCGAADGRGVTVYKGDPNHPQAVACYGSTGSGSTTLGVHLPGTSAVGSGVNTGYTNYYTSDYRDEGARFNPHMTTAYIDRNSLTYSVNIWS
ncbi:MULTISPECIES: hypothetical protein [unclassified Streptomyces]|uniref:hypothetical protein n=1 Tax=unclassified Streptomyces TaxID=2593676 RepID=UPI0006AE6B7F|nr:hypothetical protein [Streptomyces sp. WM6378]KOU37826.1 hypothetical protein ADK54_30915 [Streptomyces sp. WM6378]